MFMRIFFWGGEGGRVIPHGGEKRINKIPPRIQGQSRENLVYVFFSLLFFRAQTLESGEHSVRVRLKTG